MVKNLPARQETRVPSLGEEDSLGEGNGNPLQYSCLESPKKRLSSLRALIFMRHGNFDTEKVSVTFSCVRIFYFSRKLQSSNDLINAGFLGQV